jgi:hypothetical protein
LARWASGRELLATASVGGRLAAPILVRAGDRCHLTKLAVKNHHVVAGGKRLGGGTPTKTIDFLKEKFGMMK